MQAKKLTLDILGETFANRWAILAFDQDGKPLAHNHLWEQLALFSEDANVYTALQPQAPHTWERICTEISANTTWQGVMYNEEKRFLRIHLTYCHQEQYYLLSASPTEVWDLQAFTQHHFGALLAHCQDAVLVVDIGQNGHILAANKAACLRLQYTLEELQQRSLGQIDVEISDTESPLIDKYLRWFQLQVRNITPLKFSSQYQPRDGQAYPVEISLSHQVLGSSWVLVITAQDVTARERLYEHFRAKGTYLQSVIDSINQSLWAVDTNFILMAYNRQFGQDFEQLYHYSPLLGTSVFKGVPERSESFWRNAYQQTLDSGKFEQVIHYKARVLQIRLFTILDDQGRKVGIVGYNHDIGALYEAQARLLQVKYALEEAQAFGKMGNWSLSVPELSLSWSKEVARAFGLPENTPEPSLEVIQTLIHPEDWKILIQKGETLLKQVPQNNQDALQLELRYQQPDQSYRWAMLKARLQLNKDGKVSGFEGITLDIHEQKIQEQALAESRYLVEKITETAPFSVFLFDYTSQSTIYINRYGANLGGYSVEEVYNNDIQTLVVHPSDLPEFEQRLRGIFSGQQELIQMELRIRHRQGYWIWVALSYKAFKRHPETQRLEQAVGIAHDITYRKRAEQRLRSQEAMLRNIHNSVPGLVLFQLQSTPESPQHTFSYISANAAQLLGLSPEGLLRKSANAIMANLHPEDIRQYLVRYQGVIAGKYDTFEAEVRYKPPQAQGYIWLFLKATVATEVLETSEDNLMIINGIALDITKRRTQEEALRKTLVREQQLNYALSKREAELQSAEEELRQINHSLEETNAELTQINAELDRFVYSVSHDLRAPISSVLGLLQLHRLSEDPEERLRLIEMEERSMQRMDNFIRDILDYSRNKRLAVRKDLINWENLIQQTFEQYAFVEGSQDIEKEIVIQAPTPFYSDEDRLSVILNNIVYNSLRYYNPNQPSPKVSVLVNVGANEAEIRVIDNGIGIKEEHQQKVFEMFYRATERKSGSGLGLYIVRDTVRKLRGSVWLHSKFGEGTKVFVQLPNLRPASFTTP
jgi:PAS domain S-box-containing protein